MDCDSIMHKLHMCALTEPENAELAKSLAENPTVECENCGAQARDPKNVCSPRRIDGNRGIAKT